MNDTIKKYEIWRTNKFNDDMLEECVGILYDISLAKDFITYQGTYKGEGFAIIHNGIKVDTL